MSEKPIALQFNTEQRWQMIQEGYNPLDQESVQRWLNKQPPDHTLAESVAKVKKENLGSKLQSDQRDYSMINSGGDIDTAEKKSKISSREQFNSMVNENYGSESGKDIDSLVRSKLSNNGQNQGPIKTQKVITEQKQLITEAKEAVNLGYRNGIGYLNAFVALLKSPSTQGRQALIEKLNNLVMAEEGIAEEQIKYYRGGTQKAEKELYLKLKK